ncbi:MAG: beta-methylgalactoside transporter [Eubacteriales bacterium]|nr:beta-methylgalactoside transporter [Clostridiales bacterium]MDY5836556.1 beta-methylgalactoside transporter [Eubacteriales bacterium]
MNSSTDLKKQSFDSKRIVNLLINNALIIIMLILVVYVAVTNRNFLQPASLVNLLSLTAAYLPVALGIAGCIVLTGTDLSAGRAVGLTACVAASLLQAVDAPGKMWPNLKPLPIWLVLLISVLIGAAIGVFNGFWVAKFKLHPFIVTLATQLILYTVLLRYVQMGESRGQSISGLDNGYREFVAGSLVKLPIGKGIGIPNYVWYSIILAALMWFIWNKTVFGKNMFALGSNEEAARVSGINVGLTTVAVFALAGAMYGYTGFIEAARIASNTPNTGFNYELDAIAACVIGGVSFVGGIGKISGVIIGVLLLRLIFVALPMVGMDQQLQYAIKGGIILIACALDMRKYLVKR